MLKTNQFVLGICASLMSLSASASSVLQSEITIGGGVPSYSGGGYDTSLYFQLDSRIKATDNIEVLLLLNADAIGVSYGNYSSIFATGTSGIGMALHAPISESATFFVSGMFGRLTATISEYYNGASNDLFSAEGIAYRFGGGLAARQNALSSRVSVERRVRKLEQGEPFAEGWVSSQLAVHPTRKLVLGLNSGFNFAFDSSYFGGYIGLTF